MTTNNLSLSEKLAKAKELLEEIKQWATGQNLCADDQALHAIFNLIKKYQEESE
jgi:hypothetical protein